MNILFTTSEIASLYHLGGLGDVSRSLPIALHELGLDIRIAMPFHNSITPLPEWKILEEIEILYDSKKEKVKIWEARLPNTEVPVLLFANEPYLTSSSGVAADAVEKFSFFCAAVCGWVVHTHNSWKPDVIHLNDWHTALIPVLLRHRYHTHAFKTLLTIHNLNFQGIVKQELLAKLHMEPATCSTLSWDAQNNDLNLLMEGIIHADLVNAVSPTYAKEILTPEYGAYLDTVITSLSGKVTGILNGIDYDTWNPGTDTYIPKTFTIETVREGKQINKQALQKKVGLPENNQAALIGYVGRVDGQQKGIQLIIEAIKAGVLGNEQCHFVFLGTGDSWLEDQITEVAHNNPYISAVCKFDLELSHYIYGGCDLMVVPSKYEPCGLVQMIAMHYGTVPIVRRTGGLADTVTDQKTGFVFNDYSAGAFIDSINRALQTLKEPGILQAFREACMNTDLSWHHSGNLYRQLYHKLSDK